MTDLGQIPVLNVPSSKDYGGQIGNADKTTVEMSDTAQIEG